MNGAPDSTDIPRRLLQRLDDLGVVLAARGDALALIALGSVGLDVGRLDEHSDLDFFAIVEDAAKQQYLESIGRRKLIVPLYTAMMKTRDGAQRARVVYARARPGYHPITAASLDAIVGAP